MSRCVHYDEGMTTTTTTQPIGPRMMAALEILDRRGGQMTGKHRLAVLVGPHGSNSFGDRIVMRCVDRHLIELSGEPWSRQGYTLTLTDAGRETLAASRR